MSTNLADYTIYITSGNCYGSSSYRILGQVFSDGTVDTSLPIIFKSEYISAGFSKEYAHARISNSKLNIVLCFKCVHPVSAKYGIMLDAGNSLTLPTSVLNKLYPIINTQLSTSIVGCGIVFNDTGGIVSTTQKNCIAVISKTTNGIYWNIILANDIEDSTVSTYIWRFEFNFLLS
jgi:hypothetical protein